MSQLNFTAHSELENQHTHRNAKQFGVSEVSRSTLKKTALTDVKNILAQRSVHSAKKLPSSATKSNISKKNLFSIFNDKENEITKKDIKKLELSQTKEFCTSSSIVLTEEANCNSGDCGYVEPVCSFCDKIEDDYADILFKNIRLTKNEIEMLAMEWERSPDVNEMKMRKIEIPDAVPIVNVSISDWPDMCSYEPNDLDFSLLNDIPAVESILDDD